MSHRREVLVLLAMALLSAVSSWIEGDPVASAVLWVSATAWLILVWLVGKGRL